MLKVIVNLLESKMADEVKKRGLTYKDRGFFADESGQEYSWDGTRFIKRDRQRETFELALSPNRDFNKQVRMNTTNAWF